MASGDRAVGSRPRAFLRLVIPLSLLPARPLHPPSGEPSPLNASTVLSIRLSAYSGPRAKIAPAQVGPSDNIMLEHHAPKWNRFGDHMMRLFLEFEHDVLEKVVATFSHHARASCAEVESLRRSHDAAFS